MLSDQALAALEKRGLTKANGRPDRKAIADKIIEELKSERAGLTVADMAHIIAGNTDESLRRYLAVLTRVDGTVQHRLNGDGYVLLHKPTQETATTDRGVKYNRTVYLRVATRDREAVRRYLVGALQTRFERFTIKAFNLLAKYVVKRMPELRDDVGALRTKLLEVANREYKLFLEGTNGKNE